MIVSEIKLYELLKAKIGEQEASAFVDAKATLATKEDLANIKVEIIRWVFAFFAMLALMIIGLYFKG